MIRKLLCLIVLSSTLSWADDRRGDELTSISDSASTLNSSGDTIALGGLGDVDIADCLYSYQVFIFWQGTATNALCVADKLDIIGKHHEAAEMRCSVKRVRKVYGTVDQCVAAVEYVPPPEPAPPPEVEEIVVTQQQAEIHIEEEQEVHDSLEERLARIEAGQRAAAMKQAQRQEMIQQTIERLEENDPEK